MKKKISLFVALIMVLSVISACGSKGTESSPSASQQSSSSPQASESASPTTSGEPIRIGTLFPRSGDLGALGEEGFVASDIAREITNARGGINGSMVEFVSADIPDNTAAQNEVNRLIQQEKVKLITGTYASGLASITSGAASRNNVVYWETIAVADSITDRALPGVFRTTFNASQMGSYSVEFAAKLAKDLNIELSQLKIAQIAENSEFGDSVAKGVTETAKQLGINLVLNEKYSKNVPDMSSIVLKVKEAAPDIIIATSYVNDGINFWKGAKQLDLNVKAMIGIGSGYGLNSFVEGVGDIAQGVFDIDAPVTPNMGQLSQEWQELYKEFETKFEQRMGHKPGALAILGFQGTWVLLNEVVKNAGGTDPDKVIAAAKELLVPAGSLPTGAGIKFDDNGQNQLAVPSAMQWQGGNLVVVYPEGNQEAIMVPLPNWSER